MLTIHLNQLNEIVAQANAYKARTGLGFGPVVIGGRDKGLCIVDAPEPQAPAPNPAQLELDMSGDGRWADGR
jgi:hypothetical protein